MQREASPPADSYFAERAFVTLSEGSDGKGDLNSAVKFFLDFSGNMGYNGLRIELCVSYYLIVNSEVLWTRIK